MSGSLCSWVRWQRDAIDHAGQRDVYEISLAEAKWVWFDSLTNDYNLSWDLVGPRGELVSDRSFSYSDSYSLSGNPLLELVAGQYELTVDGNADATGSYGFRLLDLGQATLIEAGVEISGTLSPANATDAYRFAVQGGERYYFDVQESSQYGMQRLLDPYGQLVFGSETSYYYFFSDVETEPLPFGGVYTLLFEGGVGNTGTASYRFTVQPETDERISLQLGALAAGAIDHAGQRDVYEISLAEAKWVWFDSLTNDYNLSWGLVGPRGELVSDRSFSYSDSYSLSGNPLLELVAGQYELTVDGNADATGSYGFRLLDLGQATLIEAGVEISGTLSPANATDAYRFAVQGGERYYFDVQESSQYGMQRLLDPYGQLVFGSETSYYYFFSDVETEPLPFGGVYTLLFEGGVGNTGTASYRFNIFENSVTAPIRIDVEAAPAADLIVTDLSVSATGPIQSGAQVTVGWKDTNSGSLAAAGPWLDRVLVRNETGDEIIANVTLAYDLPTLAAGQAAVRQISLRLPEGLRGAGNLLFSVTVDVTNAVEEQNVEGTAETNNASSIPVTSELAPYPDLGVRNLVLNPPAGWEPGDTVTVRWEILNSGNLATQIAWSDQVSVRNLITWEVLFSQYHSSGGNPLGAGESRTRELTLTWPAGSSSTGRFEVVITTDATGQIFEANAAGTAEANNSARVEIDSAPDLQVVNLRVTSSPIQAGTVVTLEWDDLNTGAAATPAGWFDHIRVYNITVGEQLVQTAVFYDPGLPGQGPLRSGESAARSFRFQLAHGLRGAGSLEITVGADQDEGGVGSLVEAATGVDAEANNIASIDVESLPRLYADLAASGLVAPAAALGGESIEVGWTVTNVGQAGTGVEQWMDLVVLSADGVIGNADDQVIGQSLHAGALAQGQGYTQQRQITLPLHLHGDLYISVRVDGLGAVIEPDTRPNNDAPPSAISLSSPYADLVVEVVTAPSVARRGEPIDVSWRVRNLGDSTTDADQWRDLIVLSQDADFDGSDVVIGETVHNGALGVGQSYSVLRSFVLPDDTSGTFHLLVVTDADGSVYERGLVENNVGEPVASIAVLSAPAADLAGADIAVPAEGLPGQQLAISWTVQNAGDATARAPWMDELYLSTDGTLAGATYLVSLQRTFDLPLGESYTAVLQVTLPDVVDGSYRILLLADAHSQVFEEGREGNNTLASAALLVVTHPDLQPVAVTTPGTVASGEPLVIQWTVTNAGTGAAEGSWTDALFLSRDGTWGWDDLKVAEIAHAGPLAAGASYGGEVTVGVPLDASGAYRVLLLIDRDNVVHEVAREDNNQADGGVEVVLSPYADLTVSNVVAPALTIADPARVTVSWTVGNSGTGAGRTTEWVDSVVASEDDVLGNSDDRILAQFSHIGALDAGKSYARSEIFWLPPGTCDRFRLYVETDSADVVFENALEDNNAARLDGFFDVIPIPYADMVVDQVATASTGSSGETFEITWQVSNQGIGLTNVDTWSDAIYLARNADGSDRTLLDTFDHLGYLAPGSSYARTAGVSLADGIEGIFYIVVQTSGATFVSESYGPFELVFTDNNSRVSAPFEVQLTAPPDLVVSDIVAPGTAPEGSVIDMSWTVTNQGQGDAAGSWVDRVFLREYGETGAGTPVGTFTYQGPLGGGMSYTRREELRLPTHARAQFEILVITDADGDLYEHTYEDNNRTVDDAPITVTVLPRPDLQVSAISGPAAVDAGATASIEFTVINQGPVVTTVPIWTDRVYLSLDDKITSDDILVDALTNGSALEPAGQYLSLSSTFLIPERFRGTVYVIVVADYGNAVDEWPNESNNSRMHELYVNPWPFADLVVSDVVAPAQAFEATEIEVRYTVTNLGSGPTDRGDWIEMVWLTTDRNRPHPGLGDVLLETLQYTGGVLERYAGYDRVVSVTLPASVVSGTYYITPWVDPYAQVLEDTLTVNVNPDDPHEVDNNNYKARAVDLIGIPAAPDIAVAAVAPDLEGVGGEEFTVSWTVVNLGSGVAGSAWEDRVFLSEQPVLGPTNANYWNLGVFESLGPLSPGQYYTNTQTILLNPAAKGLYVIVQSVLEDLDPTNNERYAATSVTDRVPDLVLTTVVPAAQAYSGEKTAITYSVTNASDHAIWDRTRYWTDEIWFSRDPTFIQQRAVQLADVRVAPESGLKAGESYARSVEVTLPPGIGGDCYLYVFVNEQKATDLSTAAWPVLGGGNEGAVENYQRRAYEYPLHNVGQALLPVVYREPDLRVTQLVVPGSLAAGTTVDITFTVTNVGNRATREAEWIDRIYLSRDSSLDQRDYLLRDESNPPSVILAEYMRLGALGVGESYTATDEGDDPL